MTNPPLPLSDASRLSVLSPFIVPIAFALVTAPTITWLQFSSGSENLVVATALEIRRTGNWLFPTLQGQPRLNKPPLAAWIGAAAVSESTFSDLTSTNNTTRAQAYHNLAWQIRWPALLAAALTLVATCDLAQTLLGRRSALLSAAILATTYAFLRFSRGLTTDILLALFVTSTNAFLARAFFRRQHWVGFSLAGVALGLAFMSKGPVALLQSVLPFAAFSILGRRAAASSRDTSASDNPQPSIAAILVGLVMFLVTALPWFLLAALHLPAWSIWFREIFRTAGSSGLEPSKWYNYVTLFPLTFPWLIFFIAALISPWASKRESQISNLKSQVANRASLILLLCLIFLPILFMTLFRDRKERYLLPMIPPVAILIAATIHSSFIIHRSSFLLRCLHWTLLFTAALGFPLICGTTLVKDFTTPTLQPVFSNATSIALAIACLAVLLLGLALMRRRPMSIAWTTILLTVILQAAFARAYSRTESGLSDMLPIANRIVTEYPTATLVSFSPDGRRAPEELSIYTNRTVAPLEDLANASAADHQMILALFQEKGSPLPSLPAAWQKIDTIPRKGSAWHFFLLPSH